MRLGITTRIEGGHIVVHELQLVGAVVGSVACERNLQTFYWLNLNFCTKFLSLAVDGWRGHILVAKQPTSFLSLFNIRLIGETECEIQTRSHHIVMRGLTENIANIRNKLWQRQLSGVAEFHIKRAHTHQESGAILGELAPERLFSIGKNFHNGELDILVTLVENFHIIVILHLILHLEAFAIGGACRYAHILHIQTVLNHQRGIGIQLQSALQFLWFLFLSSP